MAKSFFLSLLVLFLAALMFVPQHFAVDAIHLPPGIIKHLPHFTPSKPVPFPRPKPSQKPSLNPCSRKNGHNRPSNCPPPAHF
ncbi:transmembrane protein, putative [Medicago truncatula]|uniref:Transmembrane protein, putative n=1 Tax=Medicago truncatula TaxID=3880 RepID=G7IYU2_MEDTR|nr:transmembrane protein, putative [Medicago truncatula]AFK48878.1 unknown [Medicago truncatula]